ncbi:MAG: hypothetical protein JWQ02_264 [Capsulimonas sp.]|jgi:hypothetical protein|nr:hypothetical protein [Capsulimonas sp.]
MPNIPHELTAQFPNFARLLSTGPMAKYNEVKEPATPEEIEEVEQSTGAAFPASYQLFFTCARAASIGDGFRIELGAAFFHETPPSEEMLCFADYWLKGDGDQALFDVSKGLIDGEYPVYYYNHGEPSVRKLADSFHEFIERVVAHG